MKGLVITQYHAPGPVPIPRALAEELPAAGLQVRVLTGFPDYPTGEIYGGYSQRRRRLEGHGIVKVLEASSGGGEPEELERDASTGASLRDVPGLEFSYQHRGPLRVAVCSQIVSRDRVAGHFTRVRCAA